MPKRVILLAGPAASGTSFAAVVLATLGCRVPQAGPSSVTAPKGSGEPQWVASFHSRLLRKAGVHDIDARPAAWAMAATVGREPGVVPKLSRWLRDESGSEDHLVVKEPRIVWFIPTWRRAAESFGVPCFVTSVRHPLEVLSAREMNDGHEWHPNARTAAWINMSLYTERATRGDRRAFIRYEHLATDPLQAIAQLDEQLGLEVAGRATPPDLRAAMAAVDPTQNRGRATWSDLEVDERLVELAEETHVVLDGVAGDVGLDDDKAAASLDELRQRYLDLYSFVESVAQFSVAAGPQGGAAIGTPTFDPNRPTNQLVARGRRLMRRTARTKTKAVRRLRRTGSTTKTTAPPTSPEQP